MNTFAKIVKAYEKYKLGFSVVLDIGLKISYLCV